MTDSPRKTLAGVPADCPPDILAMADREVTAAFSRALSGISEVVAGYKHAWSERENFKGDGLEWLVSQVRSLKSQLDAAVSERDRLKTQLESKACPTCNKEEYWRAAEELERQKIAAEAERDRLAAQVERLTPAVTQDGERLTAELADSRATIERLEGERLLLAKLAADEPQFFNPLEAMAAKELRDGILRAALVREREET